MGRLTNELWVDLVTVRAPVLSGLPAGELARAELVAVHWLPASAHILTVEVWLPEFAIDPVVQRAHPLLKFVLRCCLRWMAPASSSSRLVCRTCGVVHSLLGEWDAPDAVTTATVSTSATTTSSACTHHKRAYLTKASKSAAQSAHGYIFDILLICNAAMTERSRVKLDARIVLTYL